MIRFKDYLDYLDYLQEAPVDALKMSHRAAENRLARLPTTPTDPEEQRRTRHYTDSGHARINRHLQGQHFKDYDAWDADKPQAHREMTKDAIHHIGKYIQKHTLPRQTVLFHSTRHDFTKEPKNEHGHHVMQAKGFLSTSLDRATVHHWQDKSKILKIFAPKGSHAAPVKGLTRYPNEHEVLLHHGAKLHIDPTPRRVKVRHKVNMGQGQSAVADDGEMEVYHAHLRHDGFKETHPMKYDPQKVQKAKRLVDRIKMMRAIKAKQGEK